MRGRKYVCFFMQQIPLESLTDCVLGATDAGEQASSLISWSFLFSRRHVQMRSK